MRWKKFILAFFVFLFASLILLISVFRTASVKYDFNPAFSGANGLAENIALVDYALPYPGKVLPGDPLWGIKVIRDKLWLWLNTNPSREAEIKLLFADKRVASALVLCESGNFNEAISVLDKAERYLVEASEQEEENRKNGIDTGEFLQKISKSSLKHYEIMSRLMYKCPDESRPLIVEISKHAIKVYEESRNALLSKGITPPKNPFGW
jgi:hypothetical protein